MSTSSRVLALGEKNAFYQKVFLRSPFLTDDLAGVRYKKNLPYVEGKFPFLYSICVSVLFS
jgi:hypothetical protein